MIFWPSSLALLRRRARVTVTGLVPAREQYPSIQDIHPAIPQRTWPPLWISSLLCSLHSCIPPLHSFTSSLLFSSTLHSSATSPGAADGIIIIMSASASNFQHKRMSCEYLSLSYCHKPQCQWLYSAAWNEKVLNWVLDSKWTKNNLLCLMTWSVLFFFSQ